MEPSIGVVRDVEVTMPDGVVLRTDIYRPLAEGRYPTLLERTPYSKSNGRYVGGLILNPLEAVQRGYCVVIQDVRGRYTSGGAWDPFVHEAADGAATVDWIAEQGWSNGRVGVYGASYMGVAALQTLVRDPAALCAGVLYMTGSDYYRAWVYAGGPFELKFNAGWTLGLVLREAILQGKQPTEALLTAADNPSSLLEQLPVRDLEAFREIAPYWRRWHDHPAYDEYWQAIDAARAAENISVPVLHVSGWYDHFLRGHLDLYRALEKGSKQQRFLIGPWDHGSFHAVAQTMSGDREFGPRAANGVALMGRLALDWFDQHLQDAPAEPASPVRYFVMGEGRWRESDAWPPQHTPTDYFLRDGLRLSTAPARDEPADSYIYDPLDPVPTRGGRGSGGPMGPAGVKDQAEMSSRADVLCYTSEHLASPLTIAGPITVHLHASASTVSTDFTAKLVDVEPNGYCGIIADGITRVNDIVVGEPLEVEIDLWAVAHSFGEGHRVRVEISGGSFPRYDRNPNSGQAPATATPADFVASTHRVLHDDVYRSRIVLPILRDDPSVAS
jgi:putative CocE/NonD family hydrolase